MLRMQFRSTATGTLHEQWLAHNQTGTVVDYRHKFIKLLVPLDKIPEEIAKGQFLNGLKEEIRVEVRLRGPRNLDQAMDLALMVEDKLRVGSRRKSDNKNSSSFLGKGGSTYYPFSEIFKGSPTAYSTGSVSPHTNISSGHSLNSIVGYPTAKPAGEVRRLSERELQIKREKGLCYRCDDKWVVGHRCKRMELSVLFTCEDDEEEAELSPTSPKFDELIEVNTDSPSPEISLNSVMGITSPRTLKLFKVVLENKKSLLWWTQVQHIISSLVILCNE